jgi:hypothetical protein
MPLRHSEKFDQNQKGAEETQPPPSQPSAASTVPLVVETQNQNPRKKKQYGGAVPKTRNQQAGFNQFRAQNPLDWSMPNSPIPNSTGPTSPVPTNNLNNQPRIEGRSSIQSRPSNSFIDINLLMNTLTLAMNQQITAGLENIRRDFAAQMNQDRVQQIPDWPADPPFEISQNNLLEPEPPRSFNNSMNTLDRNLEINPGNRNRTFRDSREENNNSMRPSNSHQHPNSHNNRATHHIPSTSYRLNPSQVVNIIQSWNLHFDGT